ncbi:kinesin-like protein [Coemansia sp. BCRC 34301]|nr:kinesin-like protein [Coemansia sp. BCRC 34301]
MRSARASNKLPVGDSGPGVDSGDRLADPDGKVSNGDSANSTGGGGGHRYSHERMLELFKPRDFVETFAGSEHVFSEQSLAPVSMTELSSKEYELLSGPINSSASKRYSSSQQQAQNTGRLQQHHHHHHQQQQQHSHGYARSGGAHRASNHSLSNSAWAKLRDPLARGAGPGVNISGIDYDSLAEMAGTSANNLSGPDQSAHEDGNSAWLRQPIARDNVGSFGTDGVFRMGDDDSGDLLEAPALCEGMVPGAHTAASNYSSRAVSPIAGGHYSASGVAPVARSRPSMRSLHGRQPPGSLTYADDDGGAWRDLSSVPSTPTTATGQHRHRLLELAEQVKWWYRDPQGSVQGPFSASHMQDWLTGGYFPSDLQVCYEGGPGFEPLGTMISRMGGPQNIFVCSALAFLTQGPISHSGISTPATPNAISRATSAVQLRTQSGDAVRSATATPAARGSAYQLALGSAASSSAAASCTVAQPSAYTQPTATAMSAGQGAATSATQISTLLSDQLYIVSAIGEHQYVIGKLQEQHQQNLANLMQDLSQEINAVHYRAQMDNVPVQNEFLVTLQLRAQAAEERLRHEHLQLIQNQASEIGRLEVNIDPVIKEMVVRNGTEFAISFINKQLQDLSLMAAAEGAAPQASAAVADAGTTAGQTTATGGELFVTDEVVGVCKDPASAALAPELDTSAAGQDDADVVALADSLEHVAIAASDAQVVLPAAQAKADVGKSVSATAPATGAKDSKSRSQSKSSETVSAATKPMSVWGANKPASKKACAPSEPTSEAANAATSVVASEGGSLKVASKPIASTPAPWSNGTTTKGKQPKKSLLQIQQEEEEALRKRQQADEQQRAQSAATRGFGPSYADRLGNASSAAPRSLAAIMAEQSKESSRSSAVSAQAADDSANSASGWTVARVIASQTTPAPAPPATLSSGPAWGGASASASASASNGDLANHLGAKLSAGRPTAAKTVGASSGPALPSIAFLEWCYSRLNSLRGIDVCKFIEMLLTFPLKAPESTLEIITEQVYAYSTTLNGRAFAEDFVARRAKDHAAVAKGSAKSAPANWASVLESSKQTASGSVAGSGYRMSMSSTSSHAPSRVRSTSAASSSFQLVAKKGKK